MSGADGMVDRLGHLRLSTVLTGIDFVRVMPSQTELLIFLQHDSLPVPLHDALAALAPAAFTIRPGAASPMSLPAVIVTQHITPIPSPDGRAALRLRVASPGGFGDYTLHIDSPAIDPYYNDIVFSFKANCDSALDCAAPPACCPAEDEPDYPVDYRGRDFWSLRQTLLDFAAQRYPDWQDRLEADTGVVVLELLAALGDEFAYAQDRIAAEFNLETATQRRSLRHLARLVDYQLDEGSGALTWLDVQANTPGVLKGGTAVCDANAQVFFEIGHGLRERGQDFPIDPARNRLLPYLWDENNVCLAAGSTELTLQGWQAAALALGAAGRTVMLATQGEAASDDPSQPERRVLVHVVAAQEDSDVLLGAPFTRIRWDAPTMVALDLLTLVVHANLLPATSGRTTTTVSGGPLRFRIGPALTPDAPEAQAIERVGINSALAYPHGETAGESSPDHVKLLFSLPGSDVTPLTWLPQGGAMVPELRLECEGDVAWTWLPSLVGENSAKPGDKVYTLEDGTYRRVVGFERFGKLTELHDYASAEGSTVRFGDGQFGLSPADGAVFSLLYRLGNGRLMNVPRDTLTRFADTMPSIVTSVRNPIAAQGGRDRESAQSIRTGAPEAYQALAHRAVKPQDYVELAQRLPWVQRAGAGTRWTGSWPTVFVTPDPLGASVLAAPRRLELEQLVARVRQAGRDAKVMDPRYARIDLRIVVCADARTYRAELEARVLAMLFGGHCDAAAGRAPGGFFDDANFTFGTPLSRTALIAAIQAMPGVRAVEGMQVRRRGWFDWRAFDEFSLGVGINEVIHIAHDRAFPDSGTVSLTMEGGQ